jgi:hemin uptake protein HemP
MKSWRECEAFLIAARGEMTAVAKSGAQKEEPENTRTVSSRDLLGAHRQLIIEHGGDRYRLLLTKSNKLILTK